MTFPLNKKTKFYLKDNDFRSYHLESDVAFNESTNYLQHKVIFITLTTVLTTLQYLKPLC